MTIHQNKDECNDLISDFLEASLNTQDTQDTEVCNDILDKLFSVANQNDTVCDFLLQQTDKIQDSKLGIMSNILVSSCHSAEDIRWFINKAKNIELLPKDLINESVKKFGCGEVEEVLAPTLMEMLW